MSFTFRRKTFTNRSNSPLALHFMLNLPFFPNFFTHFSSFLDTSFYRWFHITFHPWLLSIDLSWCGRLQFSWKRKPRTQYCRHITRQPTQQGHYSCWCSWCGLQTILMALCRATRSASPLTIMVTVTSVVFVHLPSYTRRSPMCISTPSIPPRRYLVLLQISTWIMCTYLNVRKWCVLVLKDLFNLPPLLHSFQTRCRTMRYKLSNFSSI